MRDIKNTWPVITVVPLILTLCTCSKRPLPESLRADLRMADSIHFQFAVYYLPRPSGDPLAALRQVLVRQHNQFTLVAQMPEVPGDLLVCARVQSDVPQEYAPPDMASLQHFGRGLTAEQARALQKSEQAFLLDFGYPSKYVWEGLRAANEITEAVARETGGLLWDEQTRQVFSPEEWRRQRIASWTEDWPDVSDHTTIHAYQSDRYVRAITLGMSKIGLPDVVVENFSWSTSGTMGHLINLFCQSLAEGAAVRNRGEFDLDLRAIKTEKVRTAQMASLKAKASAVAFLSLRKGQWEEGDPRNRLVEIVFDRYSGPDVHARQNAMLSSLFGSEDAIMPVGHNEELLAASRKAKAHLPALREAFTAGLQPGEFIQVKAPFKASDGGQEWMWVEIISWQGNKVTGLLRNEPFSIPSLHAGQTVKVNEKDIFDYIRRYPDGREEGNSTGAILEKMQQKKDD